MLFKQLAGSEQVSLVLRLLGKGIGLDWIASLVSLSLSLCAVSTEGKGEGSS